MKSTIISKWKGCFFWTNLNIWKMLISAPLYWHSQKYVKFQWKETLCQFLSLFWPSFSTKSLYEGHESSNCHIKETEYSTTFVLGRHSVDGKVTRGIHCGKDKLTFLLQNLGFLVNIEKPVFQPCQKIEFLWIILDSRDMTLTHL